jgi:hypothetical protein
MLKTIISDNDLIELFTPEEVIQICIGQSQSIINFTNDLEISIECEFKIRSHAQIIEATASTPDTSRELTCLLGKELKSFEIGNDVLKIFFSDDFLLELIMNKNGYESFSINKSKGGIYV